MSVHQLLITKYFMNRSYFTNEYISQKIVFIQNEYFLHEPVQSIMCGILVVVGCLKGVRWPKRKLDSVVLVVTNIKTD